MATAGLQQLTSMTPPMAGVGDYQKFIAPQQQAVEESAQAAGEVAGATQGMEAERSTKKAEDTARIEQDFATKAANAPQRAELREVSKDMAKPFIPTQENTKDMAALFSLTNIVGFALGAGGKRSAQQAMSAMNGMLEGHMKGRDDLYKQEKDRFDESMKQLKQRFDTLDRELHEALDTYKSDKEAGLREADMAYAKAGADFYRQYASKFGLAAMLKYHEQAKNGADKMWSEMKREQDRAERLAWQQKEAQARREQFQQAQAQRAQFHKDQMAGGGRGSAAQVQMNQRTINAIGGAASALENISQLPSGTTIGFLPQLMTKDGMFNAVRNGSIRGLTESQSKSMETLFTGLTRNLAAIESSGAATGLVGLATQMEKLYPKPGDTPYDVALKMSDIRRIVQENVQPMIDSGILREAQADTAKKLIQRVERAVPYTNSEVIKAKFGDRTNIGKVGAELAAGKSGNTWSDADEKRLQELEAKHGGS